MEKTVAFLCVLFSILLVSWNPEFAGATPFEIGPNGTFNLSGIGFGDYNSEALESSFDLDEGKTSSILELFNLTFSSLFWGAGIVRANIDLMLPATLSLNDKGSFCGIAGRCFQSGFISWGKPFEISYGNGGPLTLDLNNLLGINWGPTLTITGRITNNQDTFPVPEPSTILLLGIGLIGLARLGKRRSIKHVLYSNIDSLHPEGPKIVTLVRRAHTFVRDYP